MLKLYILLKFQSGFSIRFFRLLYFILNIIYNISFLINLS